MKWKQEGLWVRKQTQQSFEMSPAKTVWSGYKCTKTFKEQDDNGIKSYVCSVVVHGIGLGTTDLTHLSSSLTCPELGVWTGLWSGSEECVRRHT